jgi:hypothetical protein
VSVHLLKGGGSVPVVSEPPHQAALELIAGGKTALGRDIQVLALLVLHPQDLLSQLVGIQIQGAKVGYLPSDAARKYRKALETLREQDEVGICLARVQGGRLCEAGDGDPFRVVLDLAPPQQVLDEVSPETEALFEQLWEEQED